MNFEVFLVKTVGTFQPICPCITTKLHCLWQCALQANMWLTFPPAHVRPGMLNAESHPPIRRVPGLLTSVLFSAWGARGGRWGLTDTFMGLNGAPELAPKTGRKYLILHQGIQVYLAPVPYDKTGIRSIL